MSRVFRFIRRVLFLLVLIVVSLVLVIQLQPGLLLQLVGFQPQGDVDEYWIEQITLEVVTPHYSILETPSATVTTPTSRPPRAATQTPAPTQDPRNIYLSWFEQSQSPDTLTVFSEGVINATFESELAHAEIFEIGTDVDGRNLGLIEFEEDAWRDICVSWAEFCETDIYRVREIDFRPGGAIIYLSLFVEGIPLQDVGVTMILEPGGIHMTAAGIILNDELYAFPSEGLIANTLSHLIQRGNHALTQAHIQTELHDLTLMNLYFTDNQLFMVLR